MKILSHRYVCMLRSFERPIIVYWLKNIWKASTLLYYCTDINPRLWGLSQACDVSATLQDSGLPWADNNLSGLTLRREECSVVWRILIKADYAKSWGQGLTLNLDTGCDNIYRGMSVTWECHVSRVTRVTGSSHTLGCVTPDVSCDHHYKHIGRGDQTLVHPWISVMSL